MVRATQVYETVLYADDLQSAAEFYTEVLGLPLLSQNELMLVLGLNQSYLLIFNPDKSSTPGREVPLHGARGPGHLALVARETELPDWRDRLANAGVEIESEVQWDAGKRGVSIYFRDPAGNSLELAPPQLWSHLNVAT